MAYDDAVAALGPVSFYRLFASSPNVLDEGAQNGSLAAGTLQTGQPTIADHDVGGLSLGFTGTQRINIPFIAAHKAAAFTWAVMVQPKSTGAKQTIIASDAANAIGGASLERNDDGSVRAYVRDGTNTVKGITSSAGVCPVGTAAHLAFSGGAAGLKLYVDGSVVRSDVGVTDGLATSTSDTTLGRWHVSSLTPYAGLMAKVAIFDRQLSDAEVLSIALPLDAPADDSDLFGRDAHWASLGYTLVWHASPTAAQIGMAAKEWFEDHWNNGRSFTKWFHDPDSGPLPTIAAAPDGRPAIFGTISEGGVNTFRMIGGQFEPEGIGEDGVVFSYEWYRPSVNGQVANGTGAGGTYAGFGHHRGSRPGVTDVPAGVASFDGAWSARIPLDDENDPFTFVMPEGAIREITGKGPVNAHRPAADEWTLHEIEIISNKPASSSNAIWRGFYNGVMFSELTGRKIRNHDDTLPKAFGINLRHNGKASQLENYYWSHCKIYAKI